MYYLTWEDVLSSRQVFGMKMNSFASSLISLFIEKKNEQTPIMHECQVLTNHLENFSC